MARLKQLTGRLSAPPLRLLGSAPQSEAERTRQRREANTWRAWYSTAKWQRLRWSVLVRDVFTCQRPECRRVVADTSQLVADHIVPHRGNASLFWDADNLQCLCKACHDKVKQSEERAGRW